ncbi:MAG: DUF1150 domain-containing protein [Pseudomonadota bacterium]
MASQQNTESDAFRVFLASLGEGEIAYLRTMSSEDFNERFPAAPSVQPGTTLYALFQADGTPISVSDSQAAAIANAAAHDLETVSVH